MFMLDNTWSCFLAKPTGGHRLLLLCPNENLRSLCCECTCVSDVITDTSLRSKHKHDDGRLWCSATRDCFRLMYKWGFLWGEGSEPCPVKLLQVARSSRLVWFLFSVVLKLISCQFEMHHFISSLTGLDDKSPEEDKEREREPSLVKEVSEKMFCSACRCPFSNREEQVGPQLH